MDAINRSDQSLAKSFSEVCAQGDACDVAFRVHYESSFFGFIMLILSLASFAGNGLVLLSFFTNNQFRQQKGNCLIINLAASDFMSSIYVMLPCAISLMKNLWRMSGFLCRVNAVLNYAVFNSSYMSLAAINLDRAIAIKRPFTYPNLVTSFRVKAVITYIWVHGLFFGTLAATAKPTSFEYSELLCGKNLECAWNRPFTLIATTCCFGISSLMLLISVFTVISFVIKSSRACHPTPGSNMCLKKNAKMLKSLYILVGVYFIFVPPYYIFKTALALVKKNFVPSKLCLLPVLMLFTATAINPFIYSILRKDQRKYSLKTLNLIWDKYTKSKAYEYIKPIWIIFKEEPKRFNVLLNL